ncbi:unnamed protein product [Closterium sp. Naga37s-1]|nr:unnamed protein product [Closterium sp. Naga37s-1]CAI5525522.1 unnamed protein product [Closterium sp. Naga37s-1]
MAQIVRVITLLALVSSCAALVVDGNADLIKAKEALKKWGEYNTYMTLLQSSGNLSTLLSPPQILCRSRFEPILARYIQTQPVTLLVPNDKAFATLPMRVKAQLSGSKLIKLLEFQMILQKLPSGFLKMAQPGSKFRTVYGVTLVKQKAALKNTVILGAPGATMPSQMAVVTRGDMAAAKLMLLCLHGTNNVILPPNVFF